MSRSPIHGGADEQEIIHARPTIGIHCESCARSHTGGVDTLIQLADGRIASGLNDHTIRLWDPATGAEIARLEGHADEVRALIQLADGRIASGSWDNTIRLWDLTTDAEIARLEGHTSWVHALIQLADGRIASGSDDNTIRLWDPATGAETHRLEVDANIVDLAALSDGRLVASDGLNRHHWLEIVG